MDVEQIAAFVFFLVIALTMPTAIYRVKKNQMRASIEKFNDDLAQADEVVGKLKSNGIIDVPLYRFIRFFTPGSYERVGDYPGYETIFSECHPDDEWTWDHEFSHLLHLNENYLYDVVDSLAEYGQLEPVEVGPEGRVWDGHHRVVAWMLLTHIREDIQVMTTIIKHGLGAEDGLSVAEAIEEQR